MQLPESYLKQMQDLLKDDFPAYLQSFEEERYYGLRINTNKISVEEFLKISPFSLRPIPWCDNGFYYDKEEKPAKHPYYFAGLYYLQEPSAMLPAKTLPIKEGDLVLDTCAAPGGKSTELLCKLKNTGLLLSNDISTSRCQALLKNIELFGAKNAWVCSEDTKDLAKKFKETFDKILVDAPCSGEGMFRKEPDLIKSWIQKDDTYYPPIQKEILENAIEMLKPQGMLLYSTCTFSKKENEEVIQYILETHPEMELVNIEKIDGFAPGIPYQECVRLYPFKIQGEGHFTALLKKNGEARPIKSIQKKSKKLPEEVLTFLKLVDMDLEGTFEIKQDKVLWNQTLLPDQKKFRLLRSGLYLGDLKKNRFEPSQALALALTKKQFKQTIDLDSNDPRVLKYLKGETIDVKDIDISTKGWVLVLVDSYPLGFGKIDQGIIKNKYAKGWRYQ